MYDYFTRFYMPGAEFTTPFEAEFSNTDIQFVRLKYRIRKDRFKSRRSGNPYLENVFDYRGRDPLAGVALDRKQYRLLKEERNHEAFYDTITETYGFAPNSTFTKYGVASVQFAGHTVYGDGSVIATLLPILDASGVGITINNLYKGDSAYLKRPAMGGANWNLTSDVFVLDRDGHAPNPSWTRDSNGQSESTRTVINTGVAARLYLYSRTIPARTDTVSVETRTQFFIDKPAIVKRTRLVDSLGNETLDATEASFASDGGLYDGKYCIEDSAITQEQATGLWRRDIKLTEWKTF